jgi:hypothetical protein
MRLRITMRKPIIDPLGIDITLYAEGWQIAPEGGGSLGYMPTAYLIGVIAKVTLLLSSRATGRARTSA